MVLKMMFAVARFAFNFLISFLLAVIAACATTLTCLGWLLLEQTPEWKKPTVLASWGRFITDVFFREWTLFTKNEQIQNWEACQKTSDFDMTYEVLEELVITARRTYDKVEKLVSPKLKGHKKKLSKESPAFEPRLNSSRPKRKPTHNESAVKFVCKNVSNEDRKLECDRLKQEYSQNIKPLKEDRERQNLKIDERSHQLRQANDYLSQKQNSRYDYLNSDQCASKHGSTLEAVSKNYIDEDGWNCRVSSLTI